jgi:pimeloyl-ACP methyl ester carboxylesterase
MGAKGAAGFPGLLDDSTPLSAYGALTFPVRILRGEHAPAPSRIITECLTELLPNSMLIVIDGAGHMGPITHASEVSALIAR